MTFLLPDRIRRATRWTPVLLMPLALGGSGLARPSNHAPPAIEEGDRSHLASRLGIALVGIGFAPSGRGFYDNSLACPRRGVIHYVDSERGRRATFAGCDLGAGVVVDGSGELSWPGAEEGRTRERFCDPTCPKQLRWEGPLEIQVDGDSSTSLSSLEINALVLVRDRGGRFPEELGFESGSQGFVMMAVSLGDSTILVRDSTLPEQVFSPPDLSLASIPNPSGSLDALTEGDVRRLASDGLLSVAITLFNETLEADRGAHTHELDCGTIAVEIGEMSPILTADLRECSFSRIGLVWDGRFTVQWTGGGQQGPNRLVMTMALEGDFEVGGGVPRTRFERIVWTADVTGLEEGTGILRLTGELDGGGSKRPFDFELEFDD